MSPLRGRFVSLPAPKCLDSSAKMLLTYVSRSAQIFSSETRLEIALACEYVQILAELLGLVNLLNEFVF